MLSILHLRYAFILGPLAGVFEFVPVVGPAVAALIVFVIAVLTSYPHLIWVVIFLGIWRVMQDYVNAPRIMGKSLEISPLVQILAVLAGGEIAGVVGALISVPNGGYFAHPLETIDQRKGSRCADCSYFR